MRKLSAYLQQALQTAYPGKKIEVVDAAGHGFAAYRTRRVLDEVLQMEPDAVIVWEGIVALIQNALALQFLIQA